MRKATKPRIQYVNALWPAGWTAEALTMKRTIATKMIVMSNELRTRGSIPGATRSETITRSSACGAMTPPRVGRNDEDAGLETGRTQDPGQQLRADVERVEPDVFAWRVRACALGSE